MADTEARIAELGARIEALERINERLRAQVGANDVRRGYRDAVLSLRQQVVRMQTPEDLAVVVDFIGVCLDTACIDYHDYGLNIVEATGWHERLTRRLRSARGATVNHVNKLGADNPVRGFWSESEVVYRPDLLEDDPYGELDVWARQLPPAPRRSIVDVPFSHGTLAINSLRPRAFGDGEIGFFQELADVLSDALRRWSDLEDLASSHAHLARQLEASRRQVEDMARARAQLEEKGRLLTAFHETARVMLGTVDLKTILGTLSAHVIHVGLFRSLMVALVDHDTRQLRIVGNYRRRPVANGGWEPVESLEQYPEIVHDLDDPEDLTTAVARSGEMEVIDGLDERMRAGRDEGRVRDTDVHYFIPVRHEGRTVAVLATGSARNERREKLRAIETLRPFFDQVAIALVHARLFDDLQARERQLRAAQKMEVMGQLTAGIAHNFNNLLQAVMGNLELALEATGDQVRLPLQRALHVAGSQAELVRHLMAYARRGLELDRQPVDMARLATEVESICRGTFDRRIELSCRIASGLPTVLGDAVQLEQALLNLCLNARDAVAESEVPRITLEVKAEPRDGTPGVQVEVADNGVGMEADVRERVFDPFFTTKGVGVGTGLGLSVVHGLAIQHGGEVVCDSEPGQGTRFRLWLPAAPAGTVPAEPLPAVPAASGGERLLVVEDEAEVRVAVAGALERLGYQVWEAVDGAEGLEILRRSRDEIDLILLDLSMPRLSGPEMLAALEGQQLPPVILFTGYAASKAADGDYAAVLEKPLMPAEVSACVRRVLDSRRRRGEG